MARPVGAQPQEADLMLRPALSGQLRQGLADYWGKLEAVTGAGATEEHLQRWRRGGTVAVAGLDSAPLLVPTSAG